MFLVTQKWASYNEKLYSSPWICKIISWDGINAKPKVIWGKFNGQPSIGGYVSISANQGDIIKTGQKSKSSGYSNTQWYKAGRTYEEKQKEENIILLDGTKEAWAIYSFFNDKLKPKDTIRPSKKSSTRNIEKYEEYVFENPIKDILNKQLKFTDNNFSESDTITSSDFNNLLDKSKSIKLDTRKEPAPVSWEEKIVSEVKQKIQIGSNLELEMKSCLEDFVNTFGSIKNIDDYNLILPIYNKAKSILERTNQKKYLVRAIEI